MKTTAKTFLTALFLLTGCATAPTDPDALAQYKANNDPLEPMNRKIMTFNNAADKYLLHPIADGYRAVTTPEMRKGMRAFVGNLKTPLSVVNNVLQLNFADAGKGLSRFVVNSTLGVFGFFDVASRLGIEEKKRGFGTTLAVWGVPEGPYLVLPFLGPSNVRDSVALVGDFYLDPIAYATWNTSNHQLRNNAVIWTVDAAEVLTAYESAMDLLDDARKNSVDYYASMRTMYRQLRAKTVADAKGGKAENERASYEFDMDDED